MRALLMDFSADLNVVNIGDEYMVGPAFLVAPVTEQGATRRTVYLPEGCDWYNFWTNERLKGGQTITAEAPTDRIPLFVQAGSIVPFGAPLESTAQKQEVASVRVYPGADADFTLFQMTERRTPTKRRRRSYAAALSEAKQELTQDGAAAWSAPDNRSVQVIGR